MNIRTILFGVIALIAAGGTAFLVQGWMNSQRAALLANQPKAAPAPEGNEILVAKKNLPAGTLLKASQLRWQRWPDGSLAESYVRKEDRNMADFVGAVVRQGIFSGEPVTDAQVAKPGERGFLAAVLTEGFRAVSVPVNATSGIAGFVFPGDRVDLLLTHKIVETAEAGEKGGRRTRYASETLLTDVRVLAVDQKLDDQNSKPSLAKTATLEVTPKQAELIAVSMELGRLSLSLRGLQKDEEDEDERPVAANNAPPGFESLEQRLAREMAAAESGASPVALYPKSAAVPEKNGRDQPKAAKTVKKKPRRKSYSWDSDASSLLNSRSGRIQILHGARAETQSLGSN